MGVFRLHFSTEGVIRRDRARAFRHGFNREIVLISSAEAEKIAGKQKLDDLTSAIGASDALSRSAGDHAEPIYSWTCCAADFLIAAVSLDRCETIDALQAVGRVRRDLESVRDANVPTGGWARRHGEPPFEILRFSD